MGVMTIPATSSSAQSFVYHADAFSTVPSKFQVSWREKHTDSFLGGLSFTPAHGHAFWAFNFDHDGSIKKIDCSPGASHGLTAPLGKIQTPRGIATQATDGSGNNGDYWSESGYPEAFFYQTWTASKSGNLTEIGVNLAASADNVQLTVTVFRYKDEKQFLSPFFKWETLAAITVGTNVTKISAAFKVQRISVGKRVKSGDRLAFALAPGGGASGPSNLPIGYLMHDMTGIKTDHVLYGLARTHVSPSGLDLKSPVHRLEDRELKWYATVV
jgi:hypothetical protein